jgi:hypothetical protein
MITTKIRKLATLRERVAQLELVIETELYEDFLGIHKRYGFADVEAFLAAVRAAAGGRGGARRPGRPKKTAAAPAPKAGKRAKITDAIRARVKKLVEAGKTGSQIAKAVGISLPSVQNIKKALGLVKSQAAEKPAKKKPARKKVLRKKQTKKRQATKPKVEKAPVAAPALAPSAPAEG